MPDYSGLDIVAGTATLPDGRASTHKFNEWVSSRLRERASIWKQEIYKQEKGRLGRGGRGSGMGADDDSDEEDEGGRRKKQKKKKKQGGKGGKGEDSAGGSAGSKQ